MKNRTDEIVRASEAMAPSGLLCWATLGRDFGDIADHEADAAEAAFDNKVDEIADDSFWAVVVAAPAHETRYLFGE